MQPRVLILHANGTNRDKELARAFTLTGANCDIVHINHLRANQINWHDYQILAIPGGFSYGDTLGAGRLLALDLQIYFKDEVNNFALAGKPIIGICNGFQALVKAGLLPDQSLVPNATLTFNQQGKFQCRWVMLQPKSAHCLWTRQLTEPIYCPIAHGEGRFLVDDPNTLQQIKNNDQIALQYVQDTHLSANPYGPNPNGSALDIAGVCNSKGNILGMMPHPENHIFAYQHPRWPRGEQGFLGLNLFKEGVDYVR